MTGAGGADGPEHTEDGHWILVHGRRWRATDPSLPEELAAALRSQLGRARSAVGRARDDATRERARGRVQLAKEGLGERGQPWWELDPDARLERARERLGALESAGDPTESA